jgi:hypothetical protein
VTGLVTVAGVKRRSQAFEPGVEHRQIGLVLELEPAAGDAFGDHRQEDLGAIGAP